MLTVNVRMTVYQDKCNADSGPYGQTLTNASYMNSLFLRFIGLNISLSTRFYPYHGKLERRKQSIKTIF